MRGVSDNIDKRYTLWDAINQFPTERVIGELTIQMPKPPKRPEIANHDLPKAKQKFYYTEQPKKGEEPSEEFLQKEVERINNGYWFFNNGILEYITGYHYFFLNYWTDRGKRLVFIDAQRDAFLWWDAIEKNNNLAFGNLVSNRRFGKTVWGTCIVYIRSATRKFQYAGIQSKTNTDGKGVFNKLISSWTKLPEWLKPLDTGETRPASVLEFFEPRKRSSKEKKAYGESLDSKIDFKPSSELAYDGEELDTVFLDEEGKTVDSNVKDRRDVIIKCLMKASTIKGKGLSTTTVEEMEKKGGKNYKVVYDSCSFKKINPKTGRNEGLGTNLFIPADYGYYGQHPVTEEWFVDEYGYSKRELAKEYILDTWENLEGDALSSAQRKDPLTIKHVWQLKNFDSTFDNELLEIQKDYLERTNTDESDNAPKNLIRRVTFYREGDDINNPVQWRDDPNGFFEMVWDFPDPTQRNKRRTSSTGLYEPTNTSSFAIGVDPFAATITTGTEKSMGVAYVYKKADVNDPENSGFMVVRYAQRTRYKAQFHKNIMLLCQYFGCKANYESDVDDFYEKFLEEGFRHYIMWRPKCTIDPQRKNVKVKYGTPSKDIFALQKQTLIADEYIKTRYHKIYFLKLVEQLIDFDPDNRTKFDEAIAFMMALIGGEEGTHDTTPTKPLKMLQVKKRKSYY